MKNKYHRALVTGGAGFIGSNLIARLLMEGLNVVSIDDYSAGRSENLKEFENNPRFFSVKCDVMDYKELKEHFKIHRFDIVFHEAVSRTTVCLKDPKRDLEINAIGTLNILNLSKEFKVKKIVHPSTASVYGEAQYIPQDERHPTNPTSFYGISKLAGEKYAITFSCLYDMDITVLRYFHVYGPRQDSGKTGGVVAIFCGRVVRDLPLTIHGDGSQQRGFTYVGDVVNANILVTLRDDTKGQVYNCASGIIVTVKELATKILNYSGKDKSYLKTDASTIGDIKKFGVSNKKLTDIGFKIEKSFDERLKETLNWYKKNERT